MRILGYGEDSVTYWALSAHMTDVIGPGGPLSDDSRTDEILFVYRPSFGRAGGLRSPQFGEFDAIVGTPRGVYLIESKWMGEAIINGHVILAARQIHRHQIFRWIRTRWSEQAAANWEQFYDHNAIAFANAFGSKPLAPPRSRLASNLKFLLQQFSEFPERVTDVLLYFHLGGDIVPRGVAEAHEFIVIPYIFHPLNPQHGGRVIEMQAGLSRR